MEVRGVGKPPPSNTTAVHTGCRVVGGVVAGEYRVAEDWHRARASNKLHVGEVIAAPYLPVGWRDTWEEEEEGEEEGEGEGGMVKGKGEGH